MKIFLMFLATDSLSKILAVLYQVNNSYLKLAYNKSHIFGVSSPELFYKFFCLVFLIPTFLILRKFSIPKPALNIFLSGCIGNFIWRFNESGVVDFIRFNNYIFNLADLFMLGSFMFIVYFLFTPHFDVAFNKETT